MMLTILSILQLWITRIAAASREHGMKYPVLMHNLTKVGLYNIVFVLLALFLFNVFAYNILPFLLPTEQRSAQSASYQRPGHHRTPVIPLPCKAGKNSTTGRILCSAGRRQRASWRLLPCCSATAVNLLRTS